MELRKVTKYNTVLGITIPKEYCNALGIEAGDYVEVNLLDDDSLLVMTHEKQTRKPRLPRT